MESKYQKINHSTLCNEYANRGIKNAVFSKVVSLQCS